MKWLLPALALLCIAGCKTTGDLTVVSDFEPEKYMGIWYEAARYDHRFERGMSNVSATYSFNKNGTIKVLNKGYTDKKSKWEDIEGIAKSKSDDSIGWLKVSFFRPFYASYKIIYLDQDYSSAIVTSTTYNYLWILVRDPAIQKEKLDELITKAEQFGFDRNKLIQVDQSKNQS